MKNKNVLNDKKIESATGSDEVIVEEKKSKSIRINKKHDEA